MSNIIESLSNKLIELSNKLNDIKQYNDKITLLNLDDINCYIDQIDMSINNIFSNTTPYENIDNELLMRLNEYRENDKIIKEILPLFINYKFNIKDKKILDN